MAQSAQRDQDRRRASRHTVDLPAAVRIGGRRVSCRLTNVSQSGALIAASADFAVGARVELDLPGTGTVEASVVRKTATHVALMFPGMIVLAPRLVA